MGLTVRAGVEEGVGGTLMTTILLPWKALGLEGLGPKAQSTARAQKLPAHTAVPLRTREAAHVLGITVRKIIPRAHSHCVPAAEMFVASLPEASHPAHHGQDS